MAKAQRTLAEWQGECKERREQIVRLHWQGLASEEIASRVGLVRRTVNWHLLQAGIGRRRPKVKPPSYWIERSAQVYPEDERREWLRRELELWEQGREARG